MNKLSFSTLFFSVLLTLILLSGFTTPVLADVKPRPVITFDEIGDVKLGDFFTLSGTIKDRLGKPIADKSIQFTLDGEYLGQARSDANGFFQRKFNKDLDAGSYLITAVSNASHLLELSSASFTLKVLPTEVQVQTVPPIAGIPFRMAGKRFVSDSTGLAAVKINTAGQYRLEILVDQYQNPSKRIEFARWLEESYQPFQDIQVPTEKVIQAGFDVYHQVGQAFLDLDGNPVDPQRISEFTVRSAQGDMFVLHDGQQRWIPASRVARRVIGLEETKLLYSVLSVTVDGSNVVNQAQQRFYTYPRENWSISLLLYSLRISGKDGLFGFPVGKSVNIEFPDGRVENYPFDQAGMVEINSLARGNYYTELVGVSGLSNRIPVALSRNQDISTKVVTYLDLAVVGLLGLVIALGLLLYGRPSLLPALWKKKQQATQAPEWGLLPEAYAASSIQVYDYRHMRYETVKVLDDQSFQSATGVERELFEKMLTLFEKEMRRIGRPAKLSGADQILLTLVYLREHRKEFEIGQAYGVSAGTVRRSVRRVKNALVKSDEFDLSENNVFQAAHPFKRVVLIEAGEPLHEN